MKPTLQDIQDIRQTLERDGQLLITQKAFLIDLIDRHYPKAKVTLKKSRREGERLQWSVLAGIAVGLLLFVLFILLLLSF
ncbi:hypothetical protein GF380_01125 [Candidatus Uhrbacteria bacterium]|nr:hypothetical protein [Candidatus Uhrbacteria bacterium]